MKKTFKALLSILLAAVMIFSCTGAAFADSGVTPVIVVHGMGGSALYKNPNTSEQSDAFSFDYFSLVGENSSVLHAVLEAARGNINQPDKFLDEAVKIMKYFTSIACDKNGNPAENVGIASYWPENLSYHQDYIANATTSEPAFTRQICDAVGAQNVYAFNYDWRLDACENGEKLDQYIELVKSQTGKSKVTLIGASEGTCVIAAYVDAHKTDNELERVVYLNGAMNGVGVMDLYKLDFKFSKEIIAKYINDLFGSLNNKDVDLTRLKWLSETADASIENIANLCNTIVNDEKLCAKLFNEVLYPVFGNIPAFWEFLAYNSFDEAVAKMSKIGYLDTTSGLYKKIANYHAVQGRLVSNIKYLKNNGVQIAIVANYGLPDYPVFSGYAQNTDVLIETKYASVNARVALFGNRLSNKRTAKNKYASPDEVIDASVAAFPDNTWFVKGVQHVGYWYGTDACKFIATLTTSKTNTDVASIKKATGIPQFIGTDKEQKIVKLESVAPRKTKIKKTTAKKKAVKISWNKVKGNNKLCVAGYQVQYSTTSDFKKNNKTIHIKGGSKTSATIKKLKSKKNYYVRVRSYRLVANKKIYSPWSAVKTIKAK